MIKSVLLDTCFLINLFDETKPFHNEANQFYRHFIEKKYPLYLSSIVISEFCVKQKLTEIPLHNFIPLNFTALDGEIAASIDLQNFKGENGRKPRESIKDDIKLLAQSVNNNIDLLITADKSFSTTINRLQPAMRFKTTTVYIPDGFNKNYASKPLSSLPLFKQ